MSWKDHKWWNKFEDIALEIIWDKPHYFKEKYGRFDVTVYNWMTDEERERIYNEVELESEKCCEECAKHRYQVRTNHWRIAHYCIPCYAKWYFKVLRHRFIRLIKKLWKKMWLKGTQEFVN